MLKLNSDYRSKRFPYWLRQSIRIDPHVYNTKKILCDLQINTVCQSARCPNIHECFSRKKCTFLILGGVCTRDCGFCAIEKGQDILCLPKKEELFKIREAVKKLGMEAIVITSVTRDDLPDGGSGHFVDCIDMLRRDIPDLRIEILVPDFLGEKTSIKACVSARPGVFSHNLETVPRLYNKVRPQADYKRSLMVLRYAKSLDNGLVTKSGLMVGLGETREEVYRVMKDLRTTGCDIITIGQYLMPDSGCVEVEEFLHPKEFRQFSIWAQELGFKGFSCSPFTRSSSILRGEGI